MNGISPSQIPQRRSGGFLLHGLSVVLLILNPVCSDAHDVLADYIQHTGVVTVGSNHIDLELELTFFERHSFAERKAMDTDGDGFVSTAERLSYFKPLAPTLATRVSLIVAGKRLTLTPLYEPELDLTEASTSKLSHHRLRIFLFTATPVELKSGDGIVIEDCLWPAAKFLGSIRAEGRDGCKLEADAAWTPVTTNHVRIAATATVKCLQAPRKPANSVAVATSEASRKIPTPEHPTQ